MSKTRMEWLESLQIGVPQSLESWKFWDSAAPRCMFFFCRETGIKMVGFSPENFSKFVILLTYFCAPLDKGNVDKFILFVNHISFSLYILFHVFVNFTFRIQPFKVSAHPDRPFWAQQSASWDGLVAHQCTGAPKLRGRSAVTSARLGLQLQPLVVFRLRCILPHILRLQGLLNECYYENKKQWKCVLHSV